MLKLPDARAVADLLGGLLGRDARVKPTAALDLYSEKPLAVGRYANDQGVLAAVCICDLRLACSAGASLTLVPAGVAASSARELKLPANLEENFREVLNIFAQLLNEGGQQHVSLQRLELVKPPLPDDTVLLVRRRRVDYEVTVEGYGPGNLSFVG
jgi:hypothetical protein